jgi:hypothetical protein
MAWPLYFLAPQATELSAVVAAFGTVFGASPAVVHTAWSGNPYNGYGQSFTLTVAGGGLRASGYFTRQAQTPDDSAPIQLEHLSVLLEGGDVPVPRRLAAWEDLRAALAPLGYEDVTLARCPAAIVDEVLASGDAPRAALLRRQCTEALVREVPRHRSVCLVNTRPDDLGAVLRAYLRPEDIVTVSFSALGLTALPADLSRFANMRCLYLHDEPLDASAFRGWSLPRLERLALTSSRAERVLAEDLRGFPALTTLFLADSPVVSLDPGISEVCPLLAKVGLERTPLARGTGTCAALRAQWPTVLLSD